MPTKDHLSKIDEEHVLYLLQLYLFSEWIVLVKARNACSHNIYDIADSVLTTTLFNSFPVEKGEHI